jgi:ABC-2 type transport system permease protein
VVPNANLADRHEILLKLPQDIEAVVEKLQQGDALAEGERIDLIFDPMLDQSMREVIKGHLLLSLQTVLIARVQAQMPGDLIPGAGHFDGLVEEQAAGGIKLPTPAQQTVPAWILFGMFFIAIPLSGSMIRDRKLGVFRRLLSFPVSRVDLLLGKVLPFYVINVLQFCVMFSVGLWLLPLLTGIAQPIDFNVIALFAVTLAAAMASTGYGLMVSCLARTEEQASAFGALSVVVLAIIGGVMIPRFAMPVLMQKFSIVSPFYWGLTAYQDVILRGAAWAEIAKSLGVLFAFALVCTLIAAARFRWSEA